VSRCVKICLVVADDIVATWVLMNTRMCVATDRYHFGSSVCVGPVVLLPIKRAGCRVASVLTLLYGFQRWVVLLALSTSRDHAA